MKTMAQKIRELRNELGYTQSTLAKEVGISPRSVFGYEAGEKMPRPGTVIKIAKVLGVSPKYLTDDTMDVPADDAKDRYVGEAASRYGEQGARDMKALLDENLALFAGGEISQSEKDVFFEAVMRAYITCKDEANNRKAVGSGEKQ